MKTYTIAALPGDGIGPECLDATLPILNAIQSHFEVSLNVSRYEAGAEHYRQHGVAIPSEVLQACLDADVDAMSLYMVTSPSDWDVLVMENQFGDILSDLGAAIVGGLGLGPSAEIGERHALFQPSHGTAPQLAGKNVANPIATILSAAMMLDWLGRRHDDDNACRAGATIENAVAQLLKEGQCRTADQGGTISTSEVSDAVVTAISKGMLVGP